MHLELDRRTDPKRRSGSYPHIIDGDRYPLSPCIVALKEILGQLRLEPRSRAPAPAAELQAAEQGAIWETTVGADDEVATA